MYLRRSEDGRKRMQCAFNRQSKRQTLASTQNKRHQRDNLAAFVEHRASRITLVNGKVGLNVLHSVDRSVDERDDARTDREWHLTRRTGGNDPLTCSQIRMRRCDRPVRLESLRPK